MSRNEKAGSLPFQVKQNLDGKLCIGESKFKAKQQGVAQEGIYSWSTYKNYMKELNYFTKYCKENFDCRTLSECRAHADDWLQSRIDKNLSPYTLKLDVSALAKLYSCTSADFIATPSRHRENITRSRLDTARDKNFSEAKNEPLVRFCKSTGLRRSELQALKGEQLIQRDNKYYIKVKGKGGRVRQAPVVNDVDFVVKQMKTAGSELVFKNINTNADIHNYRSDYAVSVYKMYARDIKTLKRDEIYFCRGDLKGVKYDKRAMLKASQALGHNRISVIAGHYLR